MSKMYYGSIDVSKITKERLYKGQKGTYLNLTIWINDEPDQFGNNAVIKESIKPEERQNGIKEIILGNLKLSNFNDKKETKDDGEGLPF